MIEISKDELKKIYKERRHRISDWLIEHDEGAAVFVDNESYRNPAIRYFTGHTSDAVLIIFNTDQSVLIPWDENLANTIAFCDKVIPFTKYRNDTILAVQTNLTASNINCRKAEIQPETTYPNFLKFVEAIPDWDIRCRSNGVHKFAVEMRMIKDPLEIQYTKEACRIGDLIFEKIQEEVKNGTIKTEIDVALLIEKELRANGCEKTGFDTLAAGPSRSWAIHCFPNYTNGEWPGNGLSLLDFGVIYKGYTSDQTITIAKGKLSAEQEQLLNLVQTAADECIDLYKPGLPVKEAADKADKIFAASKRKMPHTLGHGIGLEIHEYPRISSRMPEDVIFKPGMIITLEPGLYDQALGGVRLENDVLITETGNEVITHSKILRIE